MGRKAGALFVGATRLSLDFAVIGAPGCFLLTSVDASLSFVGGHELCAQLPQADPGASAGVSFSRGLHMMVGGN